MIEEAKELLLLVSPSTPWLLIAWVVLSRLRIEFHTQWDNKGKRLTKFSISFLPAKLPSSK